MSAENSDQVVYTRRPRTRSVARKERQEAAQRFMQDSRGDGTLENPYIVDPVPFEVLAPPAVLVPAKPLYPPRRYTTGPPPGFPWPNMHEDEDDKERILRLVRRNIRMEQEARKAEGAGPSFGPI